jgi:hypothetical protein
MSKTLGQALREAREAWELKYTETGEYDPDWRIACDEHAASAVRKAVLREAIEAAAKTHWGHLDGSGLYDRGMNSGATEMRDEIVKALTRLMGDE